MRKIINPWQGANIYHCFGCDTENPVGLKMSFFEEDDWVVCNWNPESYYQGYVDTLHGGIHSTLHDEIASWVIYTKGETAGMTTNLSVEFIKPVPTNGGEIRIMGRILERNQKNITVETQLLNQKGEIASSAKVVYRIFPQELARKKLFYPGPEAFFIKP